ncbi:MAG TPA: DNA-processing protein DprA [Atopostipes sp.]|nr:DNA-processing protein DprA [Atopostipes sp.]
MQTTYTLNEWLFALGIYPDFQAAEKFNLFCELAQASADETLSVEPIPSFLYESKKQKKLSLKKKASFATFLETVNLKDEQTQYQEAGIQWVTILSKKYPESLKQIFAPPVVLFYKGDLEMIHQHTWLGVVGARACSQYGLDVTEHILNPLITETKTNIGIVSGLARGIDAKAHKETIQAGGKTIGVIGTGLNRYYPSSNRPLQREMEKDHLVISEYPMTSKPLKHHFPERNRIIAGLSRGILVIEAKQRSGSLITAYNALEESRDVFAVPGSIFDVNVEGCHRLIQLGAILTKSSEDILKEWMYI